eukprot:s607_g14.t1
MDKLNDDSVSNENLRGLGSDDIAEKLTAVAMVQLKEFCMEGSVLDEEIRCFVMETDVVMVGSESTALELFAAMAFCDEGRAWDQEADLRRVIRYARGSSVLIGKDFMGLDHRDALAMKAARVIPTPARAGSEHLGPDEETIPANLEVTAATAESPPSVDAVAASPPDDVDMAIRDLVDGYDSEEDDPWTN